MANKSGFWVKTVVVLAVLGAAYFVGNSFLRPTALVSAVTTGKALNAVPGTIVVQAEKVYEIKSEVSGRILNSALDPGKSVKAGDLLVQLDTGDVDLEITKIKSDLAATKSQLEVGSAIELELQTAKDGLIFSERQAERGNLAASELDKRRREVKIIEQRRALEKIADQQKSETLENLLKTKERQREKMTLRAPFDGVVTEVLVHKGALIGSERIGTLITLTRIVEGKISEENFGGINLGQSASITFLGGIGGRASDWIYDAKVSKILPTADPETLRYLVYFDVAVDAKELVPGKTGEVTVTVDERQAKAIIPRRALNGNYAYVVKDGKVEIRKVTAGFTWLNGVEITEGLQAGDEVIVENQDTFRTGDKVRVQRLVAAKGLPAK